MRPLRYDLHVQLDPERGRQVRGELAIELLLERPRRTLELHAADLGVRTARLESRAGGRRAEIVPRPERETVVLRLPERVPAGQAVLRLRFVTRLRDDLRGLYAARSDGRRYAFSQLEAAEARRFFPCFDEPAFKARFRISVTTAAHHAVVSNAPVARTTELGDGRKTVRFRETPLLSTYLVALAVGELEASRARRCGSTAIRVWHVPGKRHLTGFALETARQCLTRLEAYFALPYPYAKLDLVAVPDFEAGAMENAGAVFFRETLLLVDPASATSAERKRVAEVICHELAHMWYGNLVTMAWWDDLWLNEAFATWMAFHIVDDWKPEWKMWNDFQHMRAAAMRLDALRHTHPIHTEVRTPNDATENFDLITYEKGASVVRMLERYLGGRVFRSGVRRYIRAHQEANARGADLWRALSEVSGQAVETIVRSWIEQPGLPLLSLHRRETRGRTLVELRQQRFHADPRGRGAASRSGGGARWAVPCVLRVGAARGKGRLVRELVTHARQTANLGRERPRFVYGNADEGSFVRPQHDPAELRALATHRKRLAPIERMGLLDHQWAIVRAGRAPLATFLELVPAFGDETVPDVLLGLRGPLAVLDDRVLGDTQDETRRALRAWVTACFAPAFERLGWDPARDESEEVRLRRAALLGLLGEVAAAPVVVEKARERFEAYLEDRGSLDPNLSDTVVTLGAREANVNDYARLLEASERSDTPQERRRFLMSLAECRSASGVARTCRLALTKRVPTQDVALLLARLLANPAARERAWSFVRERWEALSRRMPPMLASRLIEATPALATRAHRCEVASFFRAHPLPGGSRALEQALERFDLEARFRRSALPELRRFLAER